MRRFAPCLLLAAAACAADASSDSAAWVATTDTVGDTIVVRTERGRVWPADPRLVEEVRIGALDGDEAYVLGQIQSVARSPAGEIYVLDTDVPTVRVYDAAGRHLRSIGRGGGGPGELDRPNGILFLPDGGWATADQGNGRLNVYNADDSFRTSIPLTTGFYTSSSPFVDTAGNIYVWIIADRPEGEIFQTGLLRITPALEKADTIRQPVYPRYQAATLMATSPDGNSRSASGVPFTPSKNWTLSPAGYPVSGVSDRYAVLLHRHEGLLRIEKAGEPVPVAGGEASERRRQIERNMMRVEPGWRWDGPDIPEAKPAFRNLFTDVEGRVWVQLHTPGYQVEPEEPDPSIPPEERPVPNTWREHLAWDVFEPDGRYLGRVEGPDGFTLRWAGGDFLLGTISDELGVPYMVGYRLTFDEAAAPGGG